MDINADNPFAPYQWQLAHDKSLTLGPRGILMGILNVTPDSFSDGAQFDTLQSAISQAERMIHEGAEIIDIGGESTRPGADPVSADEEQKRTLPVIEALSNLDAVKNGKIFLSIDTYRAETAEKAILAGAHIVNDVWGFQKEPRIAEIAAIYKAGGVMMHTGRERNRDRNVVADQKAFLEKSIEIALAAGVAKEQIVLDPGFGFAKDPDENIELLANFDKLHQLGYPLLTGTSRKRFIGHYTGREAENRDIGTAATTVVARLKGSAIFRVHDVATNHDALMMADAVISANKP